MNHTAYLLKIQARAQREAGYDKYADELEETALIYEANEIVRGEEKQS